MMRIFIGLLMNSRPWEGVNLLFFLFWVFGDFLFLLLLLFFNPPQEASEAKPSFNPFVALIDDSDHDDEATVL